MDLPTAAPSGHSHRMPRMVFALLLFALAFVLPLRAVRAGSTPEVWFAPHAGHPTVPGAVDYTTLFRANNPQWVAITGKFQVFAVNMSHLQAAPDDELQRMAADLQQRHIALSIGFDSIGRQPGDTCANGEGYTNPAGIQGFTARLKRLKVRPDLVKMDSPLWFGHYDTRYCRFPIPVLVQRVASTLSVWAQAFPGLSYGESEPWIGIEDNAGWQADYAAMKDGIAATTGIRVAFVHTDANIHAHPNWVAALAAAQAFVHQMGMKYGMIYDSLGTDTSDAQWIADAKVRIDTLEHQAHIIPDAALIESWNQYPSRILPHSDPTTLSSLLFYYTQLNH
jgi:hypothetical protein